MNAALPLRFVLSANAIFSVCCALLVLVNPEGAAERLGVQMSAILQFTGAGLILFAAALIYLITRRRLAVWLALLVSAADFMWVASSIVLVVGFPQFFSPSGNVQVLAVAGEVLIFGVLQIWAAGRAHRTARKGEYRHCLIVETSAPAKEMWRIVGNIGNISHYIPLLKSSVILDGKEPGVGAVRACESHAGQRWSEECTAFDDGRSFDVRFRTEEPGFPMPVKEMRGGWEVIPAGTGSRVMVWWELTPRNSLLAPFFVPLFARQMDREFRNIIRRMAGDALGKASNMHSRPTGRIMANLVPSIC
jgi:hypothetical protein